MNSIRICLQFGVSVLVNSTQNPALDSLTNPDIMGGIHLGESEVTRCFYYSELEERFEQRINPCR